MAVAVVLFVAFGVTGYAKIRNAKEDIAEIFVTSSMQVPLESYRMDTGSYPSTSEGLQALITAPADKAALWRGPYLTSKDKSKFLIDPWGNPYQYRYPGIHNKNSYDLWSKGPDERDGTADDIGNWPGAK